MSDQPQFIDTRGSQAYSDSMRSLSETAQSKITKIVQDNPQVAKDPSLMNGFAQQNGLNSTMVNNAVKYLTFYGGIKNQAVSSGESNPAHSNGPNFWGSIVNTARDAWHHADGALDNYVNFVQNLGGQTTNRKSPDILAVNKAIGEGTLTGTGDLAGALNDGITRTTQTGVELGSLGFLSAANNNFGFKFNNHMGGLGDAYDTLTNAIMTAGNLVNPMSSGNVFTIMSHNMAFYESLAARKGWSYAIGYAVPSMAAGIATDGAFSGAAEVGTAEADAAILQRGIAAKVAGKELTPEEEAQFVAANKRQVERERLAQASEKRNLAMSRVRQVMSGNYRGASEADAKIIETYNKVSEAILDPTERSRYLEYNKQEYEAAVARVEKANAPGRSSDATLKNLSTGIRWAEKPIGAVFSIAKKLGKPMTDVKMNAMHLVSAMQAQQDPELSKLWNNVNVANGVAVDAQGRPMGTNGQMIAQYFGMDKGNMFFSPVSGLTDFYSKWMGADPLGAFGKAIGTARSFDGFTGKLGLWYGGLGIRSADDIYTAMRQYDRVYRAFEYMANHTASEIADTFRNTYIDDAARNIKASEILTKLGEAKTVEEVAKIHADIAESVAITRSMVPTLSAYEVFKAELKGSLGKRFGIVGNALASDGAVLEEMSRTILEDTGIPTKPNAELLWAANDANIRGFNSFARWLGTRFIRSSMYIDELTGAVENAVIRVGSTNAIPAIMDMLRASLLPENVVKGVGDLLLHSNNPQDYINAYRHAVYHAVMRRATAGLDHAEMTTFIGTSSDHIWNEVIKMTGLDGGGSKGLYVAGVNGEDLSAVFGSESGIEGYAGLGESHLGELRFPRAAELRGLAVKVRGVSQIFANTEAADFARLREADVQSIERVVSYHNPTVNGLGEHLAESAPKSMEELLIHGEEAPAGYQKALEKIQHDLDVIKNDESMIESQKFVKSYDMLREGRAAIQPKINMVGEMIRVGNSFVGQEVRNNIVDLVMEEFPHANEANIHKILEGLKGEVTAYDEALRAMEIRVTGPATPIKKLREEMLEYLEATATRDEADRILKNGTTVKAKEMARLAASTSMADIRRRKVLIGMGGETLPNGDYFVSGYQQEIDKWQLEKNPWTPRFQKGVDVINRFLSRTFVPMALLSGGWALRVSASEAMLNSLRFGGWKSFDTKVMQSIAKHEAYGLKLLEVEGVKESSFIRDVVAGALLGIQQNLVKGMDQEKRDRMLDDFVGTIMRYDGHLPGGVHDVNGTVFNDVTLDNSQMIIGVNSKGEPVMSQAFRDKNFGSTDIGSPGYITALRENLNRISHDKLMLPVAKRLSDILYSAGEEIIGADKAIHMTTEEVISAGASQFRTPDKVEMIRAELEKQALSEINAMNPADRARFQRDTGRVKQGSPFARNTAHEEWAAALAEHIMASVSGEGKDLTVWHSALIDQASTGELKGVQEFAKDVHMMPTASEPKHVPAQGFSSHSALKQGSVSSFIRKVSDEGHEKILGPIVNKLVREPVFLLEQHNAMEAIRDLVDNGIIKESEAHLIADNRALTNMSKYVHNPKEKTLWEQNMRVVAPFYFAQNQAWRRAFRVMHEDPGAFEKYLKFSLGVTDYISGAGGNGANPSISFPGSQFMGIAASAGTRVPGMTTPVSAFNNLNFGLSIDPGSISSVFPTGSESGIAGALGLLRPSWGPVVTVPIKLVEKMYGVQHHALLNKIMSMILGPISQKSSIKSDLFPSAIGRNVLDLAAAASEALGMGYQTDAMISSENLVLNNAMDNLYAQQVNKVLNEYDFTGTNAATGKPWTKDEINAYCRGQADLNITKLFNDTTYYQQFLDHAHAAAISMTFVKAVVSFGAPVAVSVQGEFEKTAEFQKIQNSIDPTTGKKYTFADAVNRFVNVYPNNMMDLTAHSKSIGANYPETVSAINLLTQHPELATQYPNATAFLIDRNTAYSPGAYLLETSLGLRQKESPTEYLNSLLVSAGNDYYYNYLASQPAFGGDGNKAGQNTTYQQYTALQAEAKAYGRTTNPTWYASFTSGVKFDIENKALKEMREMINDPTTPNSVISSEDKNKFNQLLGQYDTVVKEVRALIADGNKSEASAVRQSWYQGINQSAQDPYWAKQSYFMTSVLRGLPSV